LRHGSTTCTGSGSCMGAGCGAWLCMEGTMDDGVIVVGPYAAKLFREGYLLSQFVAGDWIPASEVGFCLRAWLAERKR
jgi:hypothetical protein